MEIFRSRGFCGKWFSGGGVKTQNDRLDERYISLWVGATESDVITRKNRFCDFGGLRGRFGLEMGLRVRPNANDAMTTETDVKIIKSMAIPILTVFRRSFTW